MQFIVIALLTEWMRRKENSEVRGLYAVFSDCSVHPGISPLISPATRCWNWAAWIGSQAIEEFLLSHSTMKWNGSIPGDCFFSKGTCSFTASWKETVFVQSIFTSSCILLPVLHLHLVPSPPPHHQHPWHVWAHLDFALVLSSCLLQWGKSHVGKGLVTLQFYTC